MGTVGYLQKDMKVDMKGKGNYNAISERKVLQSIRPLLVAEGLVIIPIEVLKHERMGSNTIVTIKYRVYDITDDDFVDMVSIGQGFS